MKMNNKLLNILGSDAYWVLNKKLVKHLGCDATLLLQHFIDLQFKLFDGKEFFQQQERITEETSLGEHIIRESVKKLNKFGVLTITKKGLPAKNWYYINEEQVVRMLNNKWSENLTTGSQKIRPQRKELIQKELNEKELTPNIVLNIPKEEKFENNEINQMVDEVFECCSFVENFCNEYNVQLIPSIYDIVDDYFLSLSNEEKINYLWKNTK